MGNDRRVDRKNKVGESSGMSGLEKKALDWIEKHKGFSLLA